MYEYNQVTSMLTSKNVLVNRTELYYADAKFYIDTLIDSARDMADGPVKVTWSTFTNRTGHMVERCSTEWYCGGVRMVDNVWVKRGYRR